MGTPGDSLRGAVKRQPLWTAALPRASSSPPLGVRVLERSGDRSPQSLHMDVRAAVFLTAKCGNSPWATDRRAD